LQALFDACISFYFCENYKYHIINDIIGRKVDYYYEKGDVVLCSTPYFIGRLSNLKVCVEFMKIKNNELLIEGFFETVDILGNLKLFVTLNDTGVPTYNSDTYRNFGTDDTIKKIREFRISLPLDFSMKNNMIGFGLTYDEAHFIFPSYVSVEQFAPINEYGYSFYSSEGFIITKQEGVRFEIAKHSRRKILFLNRKICKYLKEKKEKYFRKMARVRWLYYFTKPFMRRKNIWLISGTSLSVDCKILKLFEYLKTRKDVQPYLVVEQGNANIDELKKYGKVLLARSKRHKFYFLHSKVVLAAEYNVNFFMPTYVRSNEIRDMVANKKMIYWHDGKEDLSYNKRPWYNVHKFIVADSKTYEFLLNYNNGYTEDNLIMASGDINSTVCENIFNEINGEKI
jgi:hypothetical protein